MLNAQTDLQRFVSRATVTPVNNAFGEAVALSPSYLVVGEPGNDDIAPSSGQVSVFSASTGAFQRRLRAADAAANDLFGGSVAVSGNRILVGAAGDDGNKGAAYVYDATTGRQLRKLEAFTGIAFDYFGQQVALHGDLALIGSPGHNAGFGFTGAAYLFNINTGAQLAKLLPTGVDVTSGMRFGSSVALNGSLCVVGAPNASISGGQRGSVYLYDTVGFSQLRRFTASDGAEGDAFGRSVAVFGNQVLVGAPLDDVGTGSAYLFSAQEGIQLRKFQGMETVIGDLFGISVALNQDVISIGAPGFARVFRYDRRTGVSLASVVSTDAPLSSNFGSAIALNADSLVIGAYTDDSIATSSGSAFLAKHGVTPHPFNLVATKGDVVPELAAAKLNVLQAPVMNQFNDLAYLSTMTGAGSGNIGLFRAFRFAFGRLRARIGSDLGDSILVSCKPPIFNDDDEHIFAATVRGTGISAANDGRIFSATSSAITPLLAENADLGATILEGTRPGSFLEVVQDYDSIGAIATAITRRPGVSSPVNATNDTGIIYLNQTASALVGIGERQLSPVGGDVRYGQMQPRVGIMNRYIIWSGALVAGAATPPGTITRQNNQAVFFKAPISTAGLAARAGDAAGTGAQYQSFLAAANSNDSPPQPTFKATLTGPLVTPSNNEGIYRFGLGQVWRKGDLLNATDYPGVKITGALKFWPLPGGQNLLLARLSGTKVTAANDLALVLVNPYDRNHVLLREGDVVEGSDGAKIRSILRVDVEPKGSHYVVIASLTGSSATNLALLTGQTTDYDLDPINPRLARAGLKLRKGSSFDTGPSGAPTGITTKITSFSITQGTDTAGAGNKGLGHAIGRAGTICLIIDHSGGKREIRRGLP